MKTVQLIRFQPPAWQWRWRQVIVRPHMPSSSQIQWACYKKWKVEWEAKTGMCRWSRSTLESSCRLYCPGHAGVKGNDRADRLAGKATLTSGLLLGRSEVLRSLSHYLRAQIQDITPSIAWSREAWKEEALDDLPSRDQRRPSSVRRTLEPFQKQRWGALERRGGAHVELSERIDPIFEPNWTSNGHAVQNTWRELKGLVSDTIILLDSFRV